MSFASSYVTTVRAALASRKRIAAWSVVRASVPLAIALFGIVGLAYWLSPADDIDFQFRDEDGIVTTMSAISLSMASGFAGACFLVEGKPGHGLKLWWLATCLGFFYFACDELLRFHEQAGVFLHQDVLGRPTHVFRNWNDAIVVLYGVVALVVMGFFGPRVLRLPLHAELLAIGFCAYALHTLVDSLPHKGGVIGDIMHRYPMNILEESAKMFASAFFANAMLQALVILARTPSAPAKDA